MRARDNYCDLWEWMADFSVFLCWQHVVPRCRFV